jgi:hypothetical protein
MLITLGIIAIAALAVAIGTATAFFLSREKPGPVNWVATVFITSGEDGEFRSLEGSTTSEAYARAEVLANLQELRSEYQDVALISWLVADRRL